MRYRGVLLYKDLQEGSWWIRDGDGKHNERWRGWFGDSNGFMMTAKSCYFWYQVLRGCFVCLVWGQKTHSQPWRKRNISFQIRSQFGEILLVSGVNETDLTLGRENIFFLHSFDKCVIIRAIVFDQRSMSWLLERTMASKTKCVYKFQ